MRGVDLNSILSRFVTTDTAQTITGLKTFKYRINIDRDEKVVNTKIAFYKNGELIGNIEEKDNQGIFLYDHKKIISFGLSDGIPKLFNSTSTSPLNEKIILHTGNLTDYINSSAIKTQTTNNMNTNELNGGVRRSRRLPRYRRSLCCSWSYASERRAA